MSSNSPVLSFYIPAYRKPPDVFRRCLKSLFDMSFKDIEVIVVFDGPDDAMEAVAREFPVQSFVIEHGGAPKARNFGLSKCTGKYVAAWDSDVYAKPEMARRWIEEFNAVPDADFVYSGYELSNERGGFDSEPFDPYSLTSGNYIASMFPIKREKAPRWDESLNAAQDWDYWLTAVENGCKGVFIEGSGFIADCPDSGISSEYWLPGIRDNTMQIVRDKHGIPSREIGVYSLNYPLKAKKIAKILGADLIKQTSKSPDQYKMIINIGYGFLSRFDGIPAETVKIQYWVPGEIEGLGEARYSSVKETVRIAKDVHNLCGTLYEKNKLSELGIDCEVLPLALHEEDIAKAETSLPDKFSVLILADEAYGKLLKELEEDLPHISFGRNGGKTKDFSCVVSFYQFASLDEALLIAHVNGRNVISNVQAPYCGYVDPSQIWDAFKKELYEKIGDLQDKPFNAAARDYYLDLASPDKFRQAIAAYMPRVLEVVA